MTSNYITDLNYTLGNEDSNLERTMISQLKSEHVIAIAASGGRSLVLLQNSVKELCCVDENPHQLLLLELKIASIKYFEHDGFMRFWGFPPYGGHDYSFWRRDIFEKLQLSHECREYFFRLYNEIEWDTILYKGKWESTFIGYSKIIQKLFGKEYNKILKFHHLSDQAHFYNNDFSMKKWKVILFLFGNKSIFNSFLQNDVSLKKNISESNFDYYFQAFERIMTEMIARKSFFMNLCLEGQISHEDGNSVEADKTCFNDMKIALSNTTKVEALNQDIISAIKEKRNIDFVSMGDVSSYFEGDKEKNFLNEIAPSLKKDAVIVLRYYLRIPAVDTSLYVDITPRFSSLIARERVQMFNIQVWQKL